MLTNTALLKNVHKLLVVCVTFCNFIRRIKQQTERGADDKPTRVGTLQAAHSLKERQDDISAKKEKSKIFSEHSEQMASGENFERTICNFQKNFVSLLLSLLDKIMDSSMSANCEDKLLNILYRLDFNGFYDARLQALSLERGVQEKFEQMSDSSSSQSAPLMSFTSQHADTARYVPGQRTSPQ